MFVATGELLSLLSRQKGPVAGKEGRKEDTRKKICKIQGYLEQSLKKTSNYF